MVRRGDASVSAFTPSAAKAAGVRHPHTVSRARTRLSTLDSLALIITQNLQKTYAEVQRAAYARTHAHRTKKFRNSRKGCRRAEVPERQNAQAVRKNLSPRTTMYKIAINVLVHSNTAAETCQDRAEAQFCPFGGCAGIFRYLLYLITAFLICRRGAGHDSAPQESH